MRGFGLLVSFFLATAATAQNWTLLNPSYRYNYSNDGTDTIRHQIRVMDVDTLGVDSFRYELNNVAEVCAECPAIGSVCAGCFVRVNQPQFLGYECVRSGSDWLFFGPDTFTLNSNAGVGATWTFQVNPPILAFVDAEEPAVSFGTQDTVRRIVLSSGDTLLISQSFGLLGFSRGADRFGLIGVEGAGVGRVYPDPLAYFDYQPGDELMYWLVSNYLITYSGGPQFPWTHTVMWKAVITGRTDTPDGVVYSTSYAYDYPDAPGISYSLLVEPDWPVPFGDWTFLRTEVHEKHPLLGAFPGQVLDTSVCEHMSTSLIDPKYIARYGISPNGRTEMRYLPIGSNPDELQCGFNAVSEPLPGIHPRLSRRINAWYEEGVGLRLLQYGWGENADWLHIELVGAIIGGDTILPPPSWNWDVGVRNQPTLTPKTFPNPANDYLQLANATPASTIDIADLQGRVILRQRIASADERINVQALHPGAYLLLLDGLAPQRFIIAR